MRYQRNEIDDKQRLLIGAQMLQKRPYGFVTDLAEDLQVSRFFLYTCLWMARGLLGVLASTPISKNSNIKWTIVVLYLNCESSIDGIRKSVSLLYNRNISVGFISGVLNKLGGELATKEKNVSMLLRFTSDEIFLNGEPVLISVDPSSGYILDISLCEKRDSDSWSYCWLEMLDNDTGKISKIVADLGTGMQGAINELFHKALFQSDLFHYYRKLFPVVSHLEGQCVRADKTIEQLKKEIVKCEKKLQTARNKKLQVLDMELQKLETSLSAIKKHPNLSDSILAKKTELLQKQISNCKKEITESEFILQTARDKELNILNQALNNSQQLFEQAIKQATKAPANQESMLVSKETEALKKEVAKNKHKIQTAKNKNINILEAELKKLQQQFEKAKIQEAKMLTNYEDVLAAYSELRECFSFIDANGNLKSYSQSLAYLEYIIEYLQCVDNKKVKEVASFMKRHKESVLNYFHDIEVLRNNLEQLIDDDFIRTAFCIIGNYEHRLGSLQGDEKKHVKKEIADWKAMLQRELGNITFKEYYAKSSTYFGQIIRSSSMVENVNSRLRRYADSARGQLNQNRLNLIRYHLNHKPFERSEKRKGLSPYQIFFNKEEEEPDEFKFLEEILTKRA